MNCPQAESKVLLIDKIQEEAEAATVRYQTSGCQPCNQQAERLAAEEDDRSDIELLDDDDEKNEAEECLSPDATDATPRTPGVAKNIPE